MLKRTFPLVAVAAFVLVAVWAVPAASGDPQPSGEHVVGKAAVEPAYDATNGNLIFLLTPQKAPLPSHANGNAVAPLYMVEYPPGHTPDTVLNCHGVPGNCPDHDGLAADIATGAPNPIGVTDPGEPGVYGTDPTRVPGHDHLAAPPASGGDFNVAWEVKEVLFTQKALDDHAITHLTTEDQVKAAEASGYAREIDLGFAFNCSVVSRAVYDHGKPVG